jgi:predicted dehydrogenase
MAERGDTTIDPAEIGASPWDRSHLPVVRPPVEREVIRVGVVGTGFGASVHVPALNRVPGLAVAALCGADIGRTRETAVALRIESSWDDYRAMLFSGEIDAVTIAAPPHLHHPMALAACEAGVHVLCEKPMARNVAEARDMLRMARDAGICHAVAHQLRHDPARARVKQLVEGGFIGRMHSVTVSVYRSTLADRDRRAHDWLMDAQKGGGILASIGSHYIDALRWWFGEVHAVCGAVATAIPQRPAASDGIVREMDADDNTALILRFASGGLGSVHISYTAANEIGEEIVATGSEGTLAIHDNGRLFGARRGEPFQSLLGNGRDQAPSAGSARHIVPFAILAGEWVLAMRTGTDTTPSFDDGVKVQEIVDAVTRSQQLNRWIDLSGNKWPV